MNEIESERNGFQINIKIIAIFIIYTFSIAKISAQTSINSNGGDATGIGGSVSYSIGQIVYSTNAGSSISVAEGVQQPYEISVLSISEEALNMILSVKVYPNPTTNDPVLDVGDLDLTNLLYQLYEVNGKLINTDKIIINPSSINMSNLASSTYFIRVLQGNKELKKFKVIKN